MKKAYSIEYWLLFIIFSPILAVIYVICATYLLIHSLSFKMKSKKKPPDNIPYHKAANNYIYKQLNSKSHENK